MCEAGAATMSAVGLPQAAFDVDANGQATYRVDIEVPSGIGSAEPKLGLAYRHGLPNAVLGVGWGMTGLSVITRVKATYAVDGFNGAISYDGHDRFALDGQRLVAVEGAYGAPGALYFTELQTYSHVRAGASAEQGFVVTTKAGIVHEYGTTSDSRILSTGGTAVRVWALSRTTDLHGNRIEYQYTLAPHGMDADSGAYYLERVAYTSRADGTAANRFVDFGYERRPDPIADPVGGHLVTMLYRMTRISVSLGNDVVRAYTLAYRTGSATGASLISTITQTGAAPEGSPALAPTIVEWQDVAAPGFEVDEATLLDQHRSSEPDVRPMDVTGSGSSDLVAFWTDDESNLCASTYLATTANGTTTFEFATVTVLGGVGLQYEILPADVDGDGRTDLVVAYAAGPDRELELAVYVSDGNGFALHETVATGDYLTPDHLQFFAMDVNGDGRTDIVEAYAEFDPLQGRILCLATYLSRIGSGGAAFTKAIVTKTEDPADVPTQLAFWALDVNGDGMLDLVRVWNEADGTLRATSYISVSRSIDDASFDTHVASELGTFNPANHVALLPVDVNGDGTQDLLHIWQEPDPLGGSTTLHFTTFVSTGAGAYEQGPESTFEGEALTAADVIALDLDGAGATAIVAKWVSGDSLMFTAYRPSPAGLYRSLAPFRAGDAGTTINQAAFIAGDVNGDGKADLIRLRVGEDERVEVVPYTSSGPRPDLVSAIVDPLGRRIDIEYAPLSDDAVYTHDVTEQFPAAPARRYPTTLTPTVFPVQAVLGRAMYVVSHCTERNDPARNRLVFDVRRSFSYRDAQLDLRGRGWQGFREFTSRDRDSGRVTTTTCHQGFPLTGLPAEVSTSGSPVPGGDPRVPAGSTPLLLTTTQTSYESRAAKTGGSPTASLEVLRMAIRTATFDYGAEQFDFMVGHRYEHDAFGNVTLDAYLGYVDRQTHEPLTPGDEVYRHRVFQNVVSQAGWALGHLLAEKVSSHARTTDVTTFLPGDYHVVRYTLAPTTFDVIAESVWDDRHGAFLKTEYAYDAFGNRISEVAPGGALWSHEYDPTYHAYLMRTTSPANAHGTMLVTAYGYDPRFGCELAREDANGRIWTTGVDAFGRRTLRQAPRPGSSGATDPNAVGSLVTGGAVLAARFRAAPVVTVEATSYALAPAGDQRIDEHSLEAFPESSTRELVLHQTFVDGRGRARRHVSESGQAAGDIVEVTEFDSHDQPVSESLPFFSTVPSTAAAAHVATTRYDVLGRTIERRVPDGSDGEDTSVTTWRYERDGRVVETAAHGAPAALVRHIVHRFYDGVDHVRSMTVDPAGADATTTFGFDPVARLVAATDPTTATAPDGVATVIAYDSLDRRASFDNPDQNTSTVAGRVAMAYSYDPATGHLTQQTDAAGDKTTVTYDGLDRILVTSLPDGRTITRTYDDDATANGRGRLCRVVVNDDGEALQSRIDYAYDNQGNAVSAALTVAGEPSALTIAATFDPQRRMVTRTFPDGSALTRTYDHARLVRQSLLGASIAYPLEHHDPLGRPGKTTCGAVGGAQLISSYGFNPGGRLYSETVDGPQRVIDRTYAYDELGELTSVMDLLGGSASQRFKYRNRRLTHAEIGGWAAALYEYDDAGNLLAKDGVVYDYVAHFPVTGAEAGAVIYQATRDECGRTKERTADGETLQFAYDGLGALREVRGAAGAVRATMISDHHGRQLRTSEDGSSTLFVDPAYQVARASDGHETITRLLHDDRGVAAQLTGPALEPVISYLRCDHKGSVTHVFGGDAQLISQLAYDAYGQRRAIVGTGDPSRSYEGRTWSAGVGLYDFGARWYDPVRGRFLTPDSELGGPRLVRADVLNRFAFELNDPINLTDPTGNWTWEAGLGVALGAILVIGGATLIVATAGAATPIVVGASVVGYGLVGGGLSGASYAIGHHDVAGWRFVAGYAINVGVGAAIGALTAGGAAGLGIGVNFALSRLGSTVAQGALRAVAYGAYGAATSSGGDVVAQLASNGVDRDVLGNHDVSLTDALASSAITGALLGGVVGGTAGAIEASGMTTRRALYARQLLKERVGGARVRKLSDKEVFAWVGRRDLQADLERYDAVHARASYTPGRRYVPYAVQGATAAGLTAYATIKMTAPDLWQRYM